MVPAPQSIPGTVAAPGNTPPVDDQPVDNEPWFYAFAESFAYLWMLGGLAMVVIWLLISISAADRFGSAGAAMASSVLTAVFSGAAVVFSAAFLLIVVDAGRSFRASAGRAIKRPKGFWDKSVLP
jgi:hypothetical protein